MSNEQFDAKKTQRLDFGKVRKNLEQKEDGRLVVLAVTCGDGIVHHCTREALDDEILLARMMREHDYWLNSVHHLNCPAVALCLAHSCVHLIHILEERLKMRSAVRLLTRIGEKHVHCMRS